MYTCIVIDDDFSALELLTNYIALLPELKLFKIYHNPIIALEEIKILTKLVDIIFLDIEMPEMNGIELARLIKHKTTKLVFTTAHANYAINSYELGAADFLLKPISYAKFNQTVKKLIDRPEDKSNKNTNEFILVKSTEQRNRFIKIKITDIIVVEAQERSTKIYTESEPFYSNSGLSEILELLGVNMGFSRIHRSFIIAEDKIKILERTHVILNNDLRISIGRRYSEFYHRLSKKRK